MTQEPIRGKVARILNSRELVINVGASDGVTLEMYFDVLDPNCEDVRDPDTGELLGSINRPKVRVQVVQVQDRLSVAATFKRRQVNIGGVGADVSGLSRLFLPPKYVTRYETLKTTESTWENIDEKESYVKTGDPVVQVSGEPEIDE